MSNRNTLRVIYYIVAGISALILTVCFYKLVAIVALVYIGGSIISSAIERKATRS
jgi:uncharacterized membrane protein